MEGEIKYLQFKFPVGKGEKLRQYAKITRSQQISHRWTELARNPCLQCSKTVDGHPG